jgi:hypothetical protein
MAQIVADKNYSSSDIYVCKSSLIDAQPYYILAPSWEKAVLLAESVMLEESGESLSTIRVDAVFYVPGQNACME